MIHKAGTYDGSAFIYGEVIMSEKQKPLPLLRNARYPTYQLWAFAGDAIESSGDIKSFKKKISMDERTLGYA